MGETTENSVEEQLETEALSTTPTDSASQLDGSGKGRGGARAKRPFPQHTIEDALAICRTLKDYNGGNPWTGDEIARVLNVGAQGNALYYLTASSRDYGLTEGTSHSKSTSITDLGREYLFAASAAAERGSLEKAFFNIPLFKSVYDYYKGGNLPEMRFFQNTLEGQFKLDRTFHADFHRIYTANRQFLDSISIIQSANIKQSESGIVAPKISALAVVIRAFVIMPFTEKTEVYPTGFYDEVFKNLIAPAAKEAGFEVYTALKKGSDIIHSTIINDLLEAELIIADLTEHNPNVLFELGFRMAHDKPVALIRAKGTAPIFDVDNLLRVWDYNPNLWKSTLERDIPALTDHLKGTWESKDSKHTYRKILSGKVS